jgi:hypothetical protein
MFGEANHEGAQWSAIVCLMVRANIRVDEQVADHLRSAQPGRGYREGCEWNL